jgi:hypothetical protein
MGLVMVCGRDGIFGSSMTAYGERGLSMMMFACRVILNSYKQEKPETQDFWRMNLYLALDLMRGR